MKRVVLALVLFSLCLSNASASMIPLGPHVDEYCSILRMVEECDIVVTGEVVAMDYVVRRGVMDDGGDMITTDISIAVDEVIKGTPNAGNKLVKFMIRGGEGISPFTGEFTKVHVSEQGRFTLNEKVLVFLQKGDADSYARNFPYDRLRLYTGNYGERKIKDGKVRFLYTGANNSVKLVETPIDLAVKLGKAVDKDKAAAQVLDDMIKAAARAESDIMFVV